MAIWDWKGEGQLILLISPICTTKAVFQHQIKIMEYKKGMKITLSTPFQISSAARGAS